MITIKNIQTGELKNVYNTEFVNGFVVSNTGKNLGKRFVNSWAGILTESTNEDGTQVFTLSSEWEVTAKRAKKENTKKEDIKKDEVKHEEKHEEEHQDEDVKHEEIRQEENTKETPKKEVKRENVNTDEDDARQLAAILARMKGGEVDENKVREIVREELANSENKNNSTKTIEIKIIGKEATAKVENPHPLLEKVLKLVANDRAIGRYPWLFGPAGSGKSTLAKQIAEAMNLPFYSVSSLQQKYELEGYTDAVGNLVETTFYKAAKEGGVFLFDEASTTSAEVQVAWNSMLANLWYNFPKDGMIKAHKDFHVIAADNTTGRGGNSTYSARFQMDASTLDRYTCIRVDYTDEMDMRMAENDRELVDFIKDLRKAIELSRLTYTASPRALKAIKAHQKLFDEKEAFELGLCSGWNVQDIRTLAARLCGDNKYYKMFNEIAK